MFLCKTCREGASNHQYDKKLENQRSNEMLNVIGQQNGVLESKKNSGKSVGNVTG